MRLAMPNVGMPSPLCGYDDWMGRDGESGGVFEQDTERMVRCRGLHYLKGYYVSRNGGRI